MTSQLTQEGIMQLSLEHDRLKVDCDTLKSKLELLRDENDMIKQENIKTEATVKQLKEDVSILQNAMTQALQALNAHDERHATILSELNDLKESIMDSNSLNMIQHNGILPPPSLLLTTTNTIAEAAIVTENTTRSIPAPSKLLVDDSKKKDNRLVELRRITKESMNVDDEEAGLRLYKLQKTMVHVVSDLKKYMKDRNEDVTKSWKSMDISTQRVAFEMVEREANSLGVPLNMCIGYWGARRLISKSWANALRTTKKHIKPDEGDGGPEENHNTNPDTLHQSDDGDNDNSAAIDDTRQTKKPKIG